MSNSVNEQLSPKKRYKLILIFILAFILIVPSAIFFIKKQNSSTEKQSNANVNSLKELEELAKKSPNAQNIINLSFAYINNGMPGKAGGILNKFIKADSTNAIVYNNLATANIMLKNYSIGIKACQKAIILDSNFQLAKNNLKWALDEEHKLKEKIAVLNALASNKRDSSTYIALSIYYLQIGEYKNSINICDQGLKLYPKLETLFLNNKGTALVMDKQYEEAVQSFNKILQVEPNNQLVKNNIEWAHAASSE